MPRIIAREVVIDFPIYGGSNRSLKSTFIRTATGGLMARDAGDNVVVRALDHVTLECREGDRIGLVGHNGSGKSTLLRVMAGVYEPVHGELYVDGTITSMLSISLGMDPEATGYENIFLRGALMGLDSKEIGSLVDDICEFAELGDYIHVPMRTYSSGMSMRLAFAIATSMKSDIVLMDEWLSAGDARFALKAQERLNSLVDQAKILVVASHSPDVIRANCSRIIRLEHGRIVSETVGGYRSREAARTDGQADANLCGNESLRTIPMEERLQVWGLRGQPSYDENNLTTWYQSVDFLNDPRFVAAYRRGMNSGHFFLGGGRQTDLNIRWRIAMYCWAARHACRLDGDFVDCGTNTGIFSLAVCEYVDFNSTRKTFWMFDTFEGIPREQMSPGEAILGRADENLRWYPGTFDIARRNFSAYPRVRLIKGVIPQSLSEAPIKQIAYLCLDLNIAYPERAAIEHFWPLLVTGAIVIFDNYGWLPYREQKAAIDDWASQCGVEVMMLPTGQGLLIKS